MINGQNNDDNECFKWCLVRCLNPAYRNPARIAKADKDFAKALDSKDIKFAVKTRDVHKFEKKNNSIGISVFGYENKVKYPIYVLKKCCEDKHVDLLLIDEGEKKHYVLIKDFNKIMYDHTLHRAKKRFCRYCLQVFRTTDKLKCHIKDFFKINGKQTIKTPKKRKYIRFKNFGRKIKSPFMIYTDFESIIIAPEDNGKLNPEESYTKKYQIHVACSYGNKLVCVDEPFHSYLGKDAVYSFIGI